MAKFPYKLRPKPPVQPLNRLAAASDEERLTGYVHGKEASDLEERWGGAEDRADREFVFQYFVYGAPFGLPGEERQVDFMDTEEVWQPIEIDGAYAHKTGAQKAHDRVRDAILSAEFRKQGIGEIIRIPGDAIPTPEAADRVLREIFGG